MTLLKSVVLLFTETKLKLVMTKEKRVRNKSRSERVKLAMPQEEDDLTNDQTSFRRIQSLNKALQRDLTEQVSLPLSGNVQ